MNPKRQRFVEEYLIDLNGTQAAIRAGYSPRSAEVTASRLLGDAKVSNEITAAQAARAERTKVDADWVLSRLHQEAEADVKDLYDEHGHVKPISEWPLIWRKGLVAGIESIPEKIGVDENGEPIIAYGYKIKLSDRARRVEMLGKHVFVSAFREQVDHTSSDGSMSPPSLADFYRGGAKGDAG